LLCFATGAFVAWRDDIKSGLLCLALGLAFSAVAGVGLEGTKVVQVRNADKTD
jgi:hypothetical protein